MADSPFLDIPESEWIVSNSHAFAIWDRFPVSPGHVLVVTRRLRTTWFDADRQEQAEWCLFRPCPAGSRQGRLLLVQVNTHIDPEDGGRYTIKRYHSTKRSSEEGWQHQTIELQPLNQAYATIHLAAEDAEEVRIIGEFVSVVPE